MTKSENPRITAIKRDIERRTKRLIGLEASQPIIDGVIERGKARIETELEKIDEEKRAERLARIMQLYDTGFFDRDAGEFSDYELDELRYMIKLFNSPAHTYKIMEMRVVPHEHGDRLLVRYKKP